MALLTPGAADDIGSLRRAAADAARTVGTRALISSQFAGGDATIVTVTFVDPDDRDVRRAQDGLAALFRSVRAEQQAP
jgi:hypothetical protein